MAGRAPNKSTAQHVRDRVFGSREQLWNIEDFDGTPKAVNSELRRLVAAGELERVRRGVYWRGRTSRFGMIGVDDGDAVQSIVGSQAIGATGWNATNLLGLSTQVAPSEELAVTHRAPTGLDHVKIASRTARTGRRTAGLNGLEVTVLEALEGWERYVELSPTQALKRFVQIVSSPEVRVGKLVEASRTEPPVVRERLRGVLIEAGRGADAERIARARDQRTSDRALRIVRSAK